MPEARAPGFRLPCARGDKRNDDEGWLLFIRRDIVAKKLMVGTITEVFDEALDGVTAQCVRRRRRAL
jgi:hypothetical protein